MIPLMRLSALLGALFVVAACQRDTFDWNGKEDVLASKSAIEQKDGSVEMKFVSLIDAPADALVQALSDVERHSEFIEGVKESRLVSVDGKKKVVDITNTVLGRPNHAKIEWTIDAPNRTMSFRTIEAQFTDNSATYRLEPSPDGKRTRVTTVYQLRDKGGHPFPLHSLKMAIEDSYVAAVRGVKRRALGERQVVGPVKKE